ncbi:DinB family protein [Streptomyces alkaliphilus]|uniref:DinB family protein n=1 Tax=Streptomyces alkaliphilus TaxID=1472722 RepID=UPI00117EA6D0|nr:DinB family protein [Streptomyces alkaliphilus]
MNASRIDPFRRQYELVRALFEYHLERVEPGDLRWEPAPVCWTVRRTPEGAWVPDWSDTEPDPVPAPTIAWLGWHVGWWWGVTVDHLRGRPPRAREEITWPGDEGAVEWLRGLCAQWSAVLDDLEGTDLDAEAPFPWPEGSGFTVLDTVAWVNAELMKNVAEIGQLRLLRAASGRE